MHTYEDLISMSAQKIHDLLMTLNPQLDNRPYWTDANAALRLLDHVVSCDFTVKHGYLNLMIYNKNDLMLVDIYDDEKIGLVKCLVMAYIMALEEEASSKINKE